MPKNGKRQRKSAEDPERTASRTFGERDIERETKPNADTRSIRSDLPEVELEHQPEVSKNGVEPTDTDLTGEKPSALVEKFFDFMVLLRRANYSVGEISRLLKVSKSTVHDHVKHVVPEVGAATNETLADQQTPASSLKPLSQSLEPPRIFELERTETDYDQRLATSAEPNGTREILDDNDPRWKMAKGLLLSDALRFRVTDPVAYVSDHLLADVALAREWMPWVPGETREEKTRNFRKCMMYSNRYLEFVRKAQADGVMRTEEEDGHVNS